jgi:serine protease AprX
MHNIDKITLKKTSILSIMRASKVMKKFTLSAIAAATMALSMPSAVLAEAVIGEQLAEFLPTMTGTETVMAVVTYNQLEPVSTTQLEHLSTLGIDQAVQFATVPVIGVVANLEQIQAISQRSDVRSVWLNRHLEYFNSDARQITGVASIQGDDFAELNDIEYTGKGVTVMVNDSGIDATHQDLFFGDKVIDNVQGLTHASVLSIGGVTEGFILKNQPNTDTNSGHGTHCAGTIAGLGVMSDGKFTGAAPDAKLVGYGSGAVIAILDTIGAYDYAINNALSYEDGPLRVMSNSWGSSGKYDPAGPVSIASYKAHLQGILSVFAAGNSGSGEDTHNPYAQIPWGMSVGAGEKDGTLAGFSSRGLKSESGDFTMPDGSQWTYNNEVTIVAPGVDIISTRALTNAGANGGADDVDAMDANHVPFYTMISGTSMATPHVAGIVALMMEADPDLDTLTIKRLLQETATNMPGYERFEVGAGYVNARAAVAAAKNFDINHKVTVNNLRGKEFNANALSKISDIAITENIWAVPTGTTEPVGLQNSFEFDVHSEAVWVKGAASTLANTAKLVLTDPEGTEYFGNLTLPVLGTEMRVVAPAMTGTWTVRANGLTSLSGVNPDPLGLTNGPIAPDNFDVTITFEDLIGFDGLDDIEGHPYEKAIQFAVSERLMDSFKDNSFRPDAKLKRKDLAKSLVMGGAVRQYRDLDNEPKPNLGTVPKAYKAFIESVSVTGGALKDSLAVQAPIMLNDGNFAPGGSVNKLDLAYSLVQVLGLESVATEFDINEDIVADYRGQSVVLADQDSIPDNMKGYVQAAIKLSLLNVNFAVVQGQFDVTPQLTATFTPNFQVTRAEYALTASRLFGQYFQ